MHPVSGSTATRTLVPSSITATSSSERISIEWRGAVPPPDFVLTEPVHLARPVDPERLSEVIDRARGAGIAQRQTCRFCGKSFNPGSMHEDDVCQGCAEEHLGVIH
jgi:hypothetical protein